MIDTSLASLIVVLVAIVSVVLGSIFGATFVLDRVANGRLVRGKGDSVIDTKTGERVI